MKEAAELETRPMMKTRLSRRKSLTMKEVANQVGVTESLISQTLQPVNDRLMQFSGHGGWANSAGRTATQRAS